uniref:Low-density lipoprotein receptor domain class A n=1 Tax=Gongylonema pulchrum TaxID=637853 RepID=A0A183ET29_9BILA
LPQTGICRADERACGNNECVKNEYICDGEPDCRDRSDEQNCPSFRSCEPNEFKCNNGRCVQKMWLCDGDDDCGDNSDEQACTHKVPSDGCSPTEFKCRDGRQCVPQSFHCDGTNDCHDGSDEVSFRQYSSLIFWTDAYLAPLSNPLTFFCATINAPLINRMLPYLILRMSYMFRCKVCPMRVLVASKTP